MSEVVFIIILLFDVVGVVGGRMRGEYFLDLVQYIDPICLSVELSLFVLQCFH